MTLPLTQELLLIALDDKSGRKHKADSLDYVLAGAALVELAQQHRIEITSEALIVTDQSYIGDDVIDVLLVGLQSKKRTVNSFISGEAAGLSKDVANQLLKAGIVKKGANWLGFIPSNRLPEADSAPETEIRRRLEDAVIGGKPTDPRTRALISLIDIAGLHKQAFPTLSSNQLEQALDRLEPGSDAVWRVGSVIAEVRRSANRGSAAGGASGLLNWL